MLSFSKRRSRTPNTARAIPSFSKWEYNEFRSNEPGDTPNVTLHPHGTEADDGNVG